MIVVRVFLRGLLISLGETDGGFSGLFYLTLGGWVLDDCGVEDILELGGWFFSQVRVGLFGTIWPLLIFLWF